MRFRTKNLIHRYLPAKNLLNKLKPKTTSLQSGLIMSVRTNQLQTSRQLRFHSHDRLLFGANVLTIDCSTKGVHVGGGRSSLERTQKREWGPTRNNCKALLKHSAYNCPRPLYKFTIDQYLSRSMKVWIIFRWYFNWNWHSENMQIYIYHGTLNKNWNKWVLFLTYFKFKQHRTANIANIVYYGKTLSF